MNFFINMLMPFVSGKGGFLSIKCFHMILFLRLNGLFINKLQFIYLRGIPVDEWEAATKNIYLGN